jgi:hypothetical protein
MEWENRSIAGDDNALDTPAKVSVEAGDGTGPGDKEGGKGFQEY